jgi:hypothetical protein
VTCVSQGGQLVLSGTIDETAKLVELLSYARDGRLILDLGAITFINSPGVRAWISMQQVAASQRIALELRRVSEPIVHQLNIVPAARGVSLVSSFFAPYECEECDREQVMLLDVRLHGAELARMRPPPMKCPDCKRSMSFAHPPELYFTFLAAPSA